MPFEVRDGVIFYALAAIKGVGRQAAEHIVEQRGDKPYKSLADFAQRISARLINNARAGSAHCRGALDCIDDDRARAMAVVDQILSIANHSADATSRRPE